ncbi:hypothetical protein FGO68_gene10383 [Halteria grandinella]|uniref:Ras-related protein Rab-7b n=1 Tax=Halteria grandinella TaxID=5974 RepID=A0A8J8SZC6_HALGN|nr:hypothetical protein FGO68_gene10383 [Halteria grandinella]
MEGSTSLAATGSLLLGSQVGKKNFIFKIVILGDSAVGKTSMIQRYIKKSMSQVYKPTIGADFHSKKVEITLDGQETKTVTLQIWDTAGQERYQSLGVAFYRGAEACMMVYDITSQRSFDNLSQWKSDFINKAGPREPERFPFFLIGNKSDKAEEGQRKVSLDDVEKWRKQHNNMPYEETSAMKGSNIDETFLSVAEYLLKRTLESETTAFPTSISGVQGVSRPQSNQFALQEQHKGQGLQGVEKKRNKSSCC